MTTSKFYTIVNSFLDECLETMQKKGDTYAGEGQDKFANFKRIASTFGIDQKFVAMVYLSKHLDAIASYMRKEYNDPESIEGRIKDAINYLLIIYGMIKEGKNSVKETHCNKKGETCKQS